MGHREKVAETEFTATTRLDGQGIREAGLRAAEAGRRFANSTIVEDGVNGSSIRYSVKGPMRVVKQMVMTVSWNEAGDGRRNVRFSIDDYTTVRQTVFFIPITPKSVPALPSARRFAEALRAELGAA